MATQLRFQQISGSFPAADKSETAASGMSESAHGSLKDTLGFLASSIRRIHGSTDWSNVGAGVFSHTLKPSSDGGADLGTETAEWAALRANAVYSAAALNVSSSAGAITIDGQTGINLQENGTSILAISDARAVSFANLTTFAATPSSTFDVDAAGDMTLDAATLTIGGDGDTGAIDINSTAGITIDGAGASNLTTSSGALVLDASGTSSGAGNVEINSAGGEIKLGHDAVAQKISVGGDTSTRTEVELNAILVDVNAGSGGLTLDAAGASNLTTSSGALTLDGAGGVNIAGNSSEIDITSSAAVDINSTAAGVTIDGAGASNFSTSSGALLLDASGTSSAAGNVEINSAGGEIKIGDDTASGKITIGGETSSRAEVELNAARLDLNAGSNGVQMDSTGAIEVTSSAGGVSIDGAGASNLSTSSGALLLDASGTSSGAGNIEVNSAGGEIKIGDDAVAQKISIGGETSTRTEVELNAILLDLNAGSGGLSMNAGAASELVTSAGDLTVKSSAAKVVLSGSSAADSVHVESPATFDDNVIIGGDLTVQGTTTTIQSTVTTIADPLIELGTGTSGSPANDLGLVFERGSADNAAIFFDESDDVFAVGTGSFTGASTGNLSHTLTTFRSAKLELADSNAHIEVNSDVLTMTDDAAIELVAGSGDIVLDAGGDVVIDGTSQKLEFGSAGSGEHITGDGDDLTVASGRHIVLDATETLKLDSATGDVSFEDAGVAQLAIDMDGTSGEVAVQLKVDSDDLVFKQFDGNEVIRIADDRKLYFFDKGGEHISSDGTDMTIASGGDLVLSPTGNNIIPDADSDVEIGRGAEQQSIASSLSIPSSQPILNSGSTFVRLSSVGDASNAQSGDTVTVGSFTGTAQGAASSGNTITSLTTKANLSLNSGTTVIRFSSVGALNEIVSGDSVEVGSFSATVSGAPSANVSIASGFGSSLSDSSYSSSTSTINFSSSVPSGIEAGDTITVGSFFATVASVSSSFIAVTGAGGSASSPFSSAEVTTAGVPVSSPSGSESVGSSGSSAVFKATGIKLSSASGSQSSPSGESMSITRAVSALAFLRLYADNVDLDGQGRLDLDDDQDTSIRATSDDIISFEMGGSDRLHMSASLMAPHSNDGYALGRVGRRFSDLFLADGAVVNFGNDSDVTMTHDGSNGLDVSAAGGLDLDSTAGSMTVGASLADGQTLKLGKNGAVEMIFTPHGTAGSEKVSLTNTAGTAADAIALTSTAGGIDLSCADEKTVKIDQSLELVNISEPSSPSLQLYSVSSVLHWNGAPIGVPVIYRHVMTADDVNDSGSGSSRLYAFVNADRTGDSDVTFTNSTVLNKVQVYLNGQLQFVASSGGDCSLTSTTNQVDFGSTGSLAADDILQVIVYA